MDYRQKLTAASGSLPGMSVVLLGVLAGRVSDMSACADAPFDGHRGSNGQCFSGIWGRLGRGGQCLNADSEGMRH